MFPFDADCSYCSNLDPNNENHGKFWCRAKKDYVSARGSLCRDKHEVMGRPNCDKERLRRISKEHGYYIVTAITEILGLDSENEYMNSFRYLRDLLLPNMNFYEDFIEDYDTFGPELAEKLKSDPEREEYADYLRVYFLEGFVSQFVSNDIDGAVATYSEMFEQLKKRYGLSQEDKEQKDLVCKLG